MIVSGNDNHVWPFLSLCSLTHVLTLENMRIFCPNFNNLAKTKLVFHCNGLNFAQKHFVQRWRVPFFSFSFFFFVFFSILYYHSQQPVSEPPMPWGQCLLSQRHSLYLRITYTRGQQQKEWWDFLHYSDFSIFLVLVSHYAVIRVFFTVLESFVLPICN